MVAVFGYHSYEKAPLNSISFYYEDTLDSRKDISEASSLLLRAI
jgi:hypothetical protein